MNSSWTLFTVLLVFSSIRCSPSSDSSRAEDSALPSNFRIEIAEGGGVTGMWNSYTILAADSVLEWSGQPADAHPTYAGRLPHDTVVALYHTIKDEGLLGLPSQTVAANYTRTLSISFDGMPHEFGWSPGNEADSVSPLIVSFRTRCLHAIHQALGR